MTDAELSALAKAALDGDREKIRTVILQIAAGCGKRAIGNALRTMIEADKEMGVASKACMSMDEMTLAPETRTVTESIVAEWRFRTMLARDGVFARRRILLTGEPGNGKTTWARALAKELSMPCMEPMLDDVFRSHLGETGALLGKLFAEARNCVLFLDEFDGLCQERATCRDTSETQRIVAGLMQRIDALPESVILVCATNHPEMLDRAAKRRFDLIIDFPAPDQSAIAEWITGFKAHVRVPDGTDLSGLSGRNFAELEMRAMDIARAALLEEYLGRKD